MSSNWIITICQMLLLDMSQQSRQYCVKQLDNNNLSNVVTGCHNKAGSTVSSNWIITICQMLLLDMSQQSRQYCVK